MKRNNLHVIWIQPYYFGWNINYAGNGHYTTAKYFIDHYLDEEGMILYTQENLMHPILAMQSLESMLQEYSLILEDTMNIIDEDKAILVI